MVSQKNKEEKEREVKEKREKGKEKEKGRLYLALARGLVVSRGSSGSSRGRGVAGLNKIAGEDSHLSVQLAVPPTTLVLLNHHNPVIGLNKGSQAREQQTKTNKQTN